MNSAPDDPQNRSDADDAPQRAGEAAPASEPTAGGGRRRGEEVAAEHGAETTDDPVAPEAASEESPRAEAGWVTAEAAETGGAADDTDDATHGEDTDHAGHGGDPDHAQDPDYPLYHYDDSHWERPSAGPEEGGLVDIQVFLTNAERFRWFLIKSCAALAVAMVACLVGGNQVMRLLEWPLRSVSERVGESEGMVLLRLAPNNVSRLRMATNEFDALFPGGNRVVELRPRVVTEGGSRILGFEAVPMIGAVKGKALVDLHVYDPMGAFWVALQIALYGGLAVAAPFIFYFLGQFLMPFLGGEFVEVRRALGRWVAIAATLFFGGMLFCYLLLLRVSLHGSVGFAGWMTFAADEWSATNYIGFVCKFTLAMGIGFQLPVVILLLVRIGILSYAKLAKFRPYWVVLNLAGSAFITPDGSPITMLLMAAPLWVLYEISVLIAWRWSRQAAAENAAAS